MGGSHDGNNHRQSVAELTRGLVEDAEDLVRLELELAKQEVKETVRRDRTAVILLVAGGLLAMLGLLVAGPVTIVLATGGGWKAALIWFACYVVVGGVLLVAGQRLFRLEVVPPKTLESLKETREWIRDQISSLTE